LGEAQWKDLIAEISAMRHDPASVLQQ
jgi:hypothetical protein